MMTASLLDSKKVAAIMLSGPTFSRTKQKPTKQINVITDQRRLSSTANPTMGGLHQAKAGARLEDLSIV